MEKGGIDLHIHTTYSDGKYTPSEILSKATNMQLEYISITDHDTCDAYRELENIDVNKYYSGKIINGVEITTCFDGTMIEILSYGARWKELNNWLKDYYSKKNIMEREFKLYHKLLKILSRNCNSEFLKYIKMPESIPYFGYCKWLIYNEFIKYQENVDFLCKYNIKNYEDFLRKGLSNKKSSLYIDQGEFYEKPQNIVNLIHNFGGLAFLAHIYKYPVENHMIFLQNILKNKVNLDGLEACYTTFNDNQEKEILDFCTINKMYVSGGSDFHGENKPNAKLGYGTSGKRISKKYIKMWLNKI